MRHVLIAAALLGACSVDTLSNGAEDTAGGYEMQIAASADGQIYLWHRDYTKILNLASPLIITNSAFNSPFPPPASLAKRWSR